MNRTDFIFLLIAGALCFGFGSFTGYQCGRGESSIDTIRTVEYIERPDTALIAEVRDSIDAEYELIIDEHIRDLEREALNREGLSTKLDSLMAINNHLINRVRELSRRQVLSLEIRGCGLVMLYYEPLTKEATATVTQRPPERLEIIRIETTRIVSKHSWTVTGAVAVVLSIIFILVN